MSTRNIGRIPIVQEDRIVGIVTRTDILKVTELRKI
ncbi:MAG: CBS domain-containing protein [Methanoregula sp.]